MQNIDKMTRGLPLTDEDRLPWLERQQAAITEWIAAGGEVVLASSLLKAAYRTIVFGSHAEEIGLVYLKAGLSLLEQRLRLRTEHFMKEGLLASQLAILEEPMDALVLDAADAPPHLVKHIRSTFGL